ncbi:eukaryotic aspartyl protease family protein [Striga asiatica]|uniref:Eukaryotic aspartyl protease family protein n=1 Tax=Striga asiatica TaxID=4170 RepID=A0A5A7QUH6_STRAF|nr:eukaryotic aspartyl protease family protein [Striga asiatica]
MVPITIILKTIFAITISFIPFSTCDLISPEATSTAHSTGLTLDLIHRDSPQSPSYDPSLSHSQRLTNSFLRSLKRLHYFNSQNTLASSLPDTDLVNAAGEYLLKYSLGTPPVPSLGIADTGSNLIWTQCQPCLTCFNQTLPIFTPKASSTYKKVLCKTPACTSFPGSSCSTTRGTCAYSEDYLDGSYSRGELSTDTFGLGGGKTVFSVPNVAFGCGFKNNIKFFDGGESGIIGLGGGPLSLVRQLGPLAQGKFSYCLLTVSDKSSTSRLHFGDRALVAGPGTVSTPLARKSPQTFYYATMEGISVGGQRLGFNDGPGPAQEGNIIVDSGTTLTLLPPGLYGRLREAVKRSVNLREVKDPKGVLDLCFMSREDKVRIPDVVVHFKGADVKWGQDNLLVRTSDESVCLAVLPFEGGAIYGNVAQGNFLVGYDLEARTLSFKPAQCAQS